MIETAIRRCGWTALALGVLGAGGARAQSLEPYDLVSRAAGTNMLEAEFTFDRSDGFKFVNVPVVHGTGFDEYSGTLRYEYFFNVAGLPAAVQLFQGATLYSDAKFAGAPFGNNGGLNQLQATDTALSAELWPYVDKAHGTEVYTALYLTPPDGGFGKTNEFNASNGAWGGTVQTGFFQAFGPHLSVEAAGDAGFVGDVQLPAGTRSISAVYTAQLWGNWDWGNGLQTSLGYLGSWGGIRAIDGVKTERLQDYQRLRADIGYWWTPRLETDAQFAHDIAFDGGYRLGLAAIARVRVLF